MPTKSKETEEQLNVITQQAAELKKSLQRFLIEKMRVQPETLRDKKEIDLDKHLAQSLIEQIDHFTTAIAEDNSTECYCELELAECNHNCKF